jgi:predicted secreted Zn-dependent protease
MNAKTDWKEVANGVSRHERDWGETINSSNNKRATKL